ncbi:leucine-rich repeat extensin-like protein 5 [Aplysia californica]|uniref:Leucine-rich repeat extensin-like protein 5 n=1 Tax=Aplysia californica TaxID=6500 RepID=A0ABM0JY69_APLCA|nr:leucine-rich repeat extensin-like protein 5 [Aplysia californica]
MASESKPKGYLWVFRAGIGFILLAALLFLLGFCTTNWHDDDVTSWGLWEKCEGASCSSITSDSLPAYHIATQAFQVIALVLYIVSPIAHFFFFCSNKDNSTSWKTRIFDVGYALGAAFHLSSIPLFGLEHPTSSTLSWSFNMSAASVAIGVVGIILVIISRRKAMKNFGFRKPNRIGARASLVGFAGGSRTGGRSSPGGSSGKNSKSNTPRGSTHDSRWAQGGGGRGRNLPPSPLVRDSSYPPPPPGPSPFATYTSGAPYPKGYGQQAVPRNAIHQGGIHRGIHPGVETYPPPPQPHPSHYQTPHPPPGMNAANPAYPPSGPITQGYMSNPQAMSQGPQHFAPPSTSSSYPSPEQPSAPIDDGSYPPSYSEVVGGDHNTAEKQ